MSFFKQPEDELDDGDASDELDEDDYDVGLVAKKKKRVAA